MALCPDWPNCICAALHQGYEEKLEQWLDESLPPPTEAEIAKAAPVIRKMLYCLSKHCPDHQVKFMAGIQFYDRVWDQFDLPRKYPISDQALMMMMTGKW
jgi:hypothetical protein